MKFRFDPDLEFQNQAIAAAVRLFEGAPRQETGFALVAENGVVGNSSFRPATAATTSRPTRG